MSGTTRESPGPSGRGRDHPGTVPIAEVRRIAALARLELEDAARMAEELGSILEHMEVLGDIESPSAAESEPVPEPVLLRDDALTASRGLVRPEQLSAAAQAGFFTVPRLSAMESGE